MENDNTGMPVASFSSKVHNLLVCRPIHTFQQVRPIKLSGGNIWADMHNYLLLVMDLNEKRIGQMYLPNLWRTTCQVKIQKEIKGMTSDCNWWTALQA